MSSQVQSYPKDPSPSEYTGGKYSIPPLAAPLAQVHEPKASDTSTFSQSINRSIIADRKLSKSLVQTERFGSYLIICVHFFSEERPSVKNSVG